MLRVKRLFGSLTDPLGGFSVKQRGSLEADLGVVRSTDMIDLPKLESQEKYPVLTTTQDRLKYHLGRSRQRP